MNEVPAGFVPIFRTSPFLDLVGPFFHKGQGADLVVGLRVAAQHANARGFAHGGVLTTMADIALGYTASTLRDPPVRMVTASLTTDFAGSARVGDWVEARADVQKLGGRLVFVNAYLTVGEARIVRASAVFARTDRPTGTDADTNADTDVDV